MSDLRVGLIGHGYSGRTFHVPLINAVPGMSVTALASNTAKRGDAGLAEVEIFADPTDLLACRNIDLFVIASPNSTHAHLTRQALDVGVPIVVDKPFTPTLDEARELVRLADERSVMLAVFQNRRWDSDFLAMRSAIASGRLGRVVHFESRIERVRPHVRDRWRDRNLPASGLWFDLGPHLVDQSLLLFGLPDKVVASFANQRDGAVVDDWAHVVLEHRQLRSVLHCSMLGAGMPRFAANGTSGTAIKREADRQESQLLAGVVPGSGGWGNDPDPLVIIDHQAGTSKLAALGDQRRFYVEIAAHLRGEAPNPVPGAQVLAVMAVLETAAQAAATGQAIEIDLTEAEREAWSSSMAQFRPSMAANASVVSAQNPSLANWT